MTKKYILTNIVWDVDEKEDLENLPNEVEITLDDVDEFDTWEEISERISDKLSDEYGFCHNGFLFDEFEV